MLILNDKKYYRIENEDVKDYYYISKDGEVVSDFWKTPKILFTRVDKDGYLELAMVKKNGKRSPKRISRLVANTFIPNPNNYPVVNHKNGIVDDNRVENLEWCTISYNTQHGYDKLGVIAGRQKVIQATNMRTNLTLTFKSMGESAEYFNSDVSVISRKLSGENKNPSKYGKLKDIYFECLGYTNVTTIENFTNVESE